MACDIKFLLLFARSVGGTRRIFKRKRQRAPAHKSFYIAEPLTLLRALADAISHVVSWQDQEHTKFSDEFKITLKAMKKFSEMSDQHVPYLLRKAQRIEEYLNQR